MKKKAKENFESNLDNILLDNSTNPKTYWKIMKMLIKSNKGSNCIPPLRNTINDEHLDEMVYDDDKKCELLNKYFSLVSKLQEENIPVPPFESKTNDSITDIFVTASEIVDFIQILDLKKASGPDKISHKMLKIAPEKIAEPLQIIFSKSLRQGKYPSSWKIAHVIAIYKKGDASLPSNYRPISLISCVGKIMERVVYTNVYNYLVRNKLIYEYQSGFLPKHSTIHQLLELYNSILNSLEKKEFSCFLFCDFSKAFDKVWHRGLIHKMNSYGMKGPLIKWFENYLYQRKQKVINRATSSTVCEVSAGGPQGSVLGPLLFLIYINDIGEKLLSLSRLFADDTSLGYSSQNVVEIENVINHDLCELNTWSTKWLMSFNPDKTEIMLFSNTDVRYNFNFTFNGNNIPITTSHKHLGVTLSCDAKWNNHIENIILSVSRHLGILRKLKYRLSRQNLEKLYLVYIRPIFEYACEIWDNCGVCYSTKLEKLQLDAARIVTGLPIFTKTDKLYSETGWTTLSSRRHNRKLQLFYNIKNGHAPNYLRELIPPTVQSTTIYPLRNGSDLIIPFCRLSITTESFIPSTVKLWNRLDQFDRNLDTLTKFKKAIRKEQSDKTKRIPKHFYYGPRKLNIILTQLRSSYSFLNYDLSKVNIVNDAACSCGAPREDAFHYFFTCPNYTEIRRIMMNNLNWVQTSDWNLNLLIRGSDDLTYEENINIIKHVFNFIKSSKRFLVV